MNSAIFLTVQNNSEKPDTLYGVESNIADLVEIHETYKVNEEKMGMRHIEQIVIPSNSAVQLKPRSFHVMLIDLKDNLEIDKNVEAKLLFRNAGEIEFTAIVKEININPNN